MTGGRAGLALDWPSPAFLQHCVSKAENSRHQGFLLVLRTFLL